jgi:hypothetical protein
MPIATTVFAIAAMGAAAAVGKRHDYFHFVGQWSHTMAGGDPWDQNLGAIAENPGYGPLFTIFAPLAEIHELLPKLLLTLAWVGTAVAFTRIFEADEELRRLAPFVLAYFALNPFFWIEIALYGHFDILVAAACAASIHLLLLNREQLAGAVLAMGGLLKVMPVVALPFLIAARPAQWKGIIVGFIAAVVAVEAAAYAIWGTSALTFPLLNAQENSKLLSIFQFLRGDYSPLNLLVDNPDVDWASLPLLVIAGLLLVWGLALRRAHLVVAVIISFVVVLALYLRGHPQFQIMVFVLVPLLALTLEDGVRRSRLLWTTLALYLSWVVAFDIVYVLGGQLLREPWVNLREIVGLPSFMLATVTVIVLLRFRNVRLRMPKTRPTRRHVTDQRWSEVDYSTSESEG